MSSTGARFVWTENYIRRSGLPMRRSGAHGARPLVIAADHHISDDEMVSSLAQLAAKYPPPGSIGEVIPPGSALRFWE